MNAYFHRISGVQPNGVLKRKNEILFHKIKRLSFIFILSMAFKYSFHVNILHFLQSIAFNFSFPLKSLN